MIVVEADSVAADAPIVSFPNHHPAVYVADALPLAFVTSDVELSRGEMIVLVPRIPLCQLANRSETATPATGLPNASVAVAITVELPGDVGFDERTTEGTAVRPRCASGPAISWSVADFDNDPSAMETTSSSAVVDAMMRAV